MVLFVLPHGQRFAYGMWKRFGARRRFGWHFKSGFGGTGCAALVVINIRESQQIFIAYSHTLI
jgi:hypothetical protein